MLFGAVIAAYAPSLQMHMLPLPDTPGVRFRLAVAALRELMRARGEPSRGLSAEQVSRALRTDPLQVEPLLDTARRHRLGRPSRRSRRRALRAVVRPRHDAGAAACSRSCCSTRRRRCTGFWQRARFDELTLADIVRA